MATNFFRYASLSSSSTSIPKIKSITSMATIFFLCVVLSSFPTASTKSSPKPPLPSSKSQCSCPSSKTPLASISSILAPTVIATPICATTPPSLGYSTTTYYGNSDEKGSPEYTYDVPDAWSGRLLSSDEKGPGRKDSEFYNPEQEEEKVYLTFLTGFRQLKPIENVVRRLGSYDWDLDRLIASKNSMPCDEMKDENGHEYYRCEIYANTGHSWIWLAFAKNKIYAHVVIAPTRRWSRRKDMLRHIHESFKIVG